LARAIRKHGKENFELEFICRIAPLESALIFESNLIQKLSTQFPRGYNASSGGTGPVGAKWSKRSRIQYKQTLSSIKIREKKSDILKKQWSDPKFREKRIASMRGIKKSKGWTPERRLALKERLRGNRFAARKTGREQP
jgi:hypothetical protein